MKIPKRQSEKKPKTRQEMVDECLSQMPRAYRACYKKAVDGKSLRAAINSFCLKCVCWQSKEIRLCTDFACPLWKVRPYQDVPQNGHEGRNIGAELIESEN